MRGDKFSEAKKVVTFFSLEHGKKKGVASGLGKMTTRFAASLEVITHSSLVFYESRRSDLHNIDQCNTINAFPKIKSDLDRLRPATYLTELVRETIPGSAPLPDIFKLFLLFLKIIDTDEKPPSQTLLRFFEVRLLKMLGILPALDKCHHCGEIPNPAGNVFNPFEAEILCGKCNKRKDLPTISLGSIFFIKTAGEIPMQKIKSLRIQGEKQEKEVRETLHTIITSFINKELHSYRFLYNDPLNP